ncbi:hypothetical protein ACWED2_06960 [Amycolatopsis sp. NPDC005003]
MGQSSEFAEARSAERRSEFAEARPVEQVHPFRSDAVEVAQRSESVEPRSGRASEFRPEPRPAEREREPEFRFGSGDGRAAQYRPDPPEPRKGAAPAEPLSAERGRPPEPDEVRPAQRSGSGGPEREPEFRREPVEAREAVEAAPSEEIGKTKFSWAALAEARLRETAAERESAPTRVTPALPLAPEPAAEREPWAAEGRQPEPQPSTRHDAEHGSVAARSVLDRLGISASGGAGGRRRAEDADSPRAGEPARPEPELAPPPRPEDEPPSVPDYRDEAEPWLPRLRMPPSLEPMEDFGHWTPATAPFPESYARAIAEDEPPPDAGLADLLARALAEHQAGTASAAALVKQLDSQNAGRRNGHGRNGHGAEVPDSRGHSSRD